MIFKIVFKRNLPLGTYLIKELVFLDFQGKSWDSYWKKYCYHKCSQQMCPVYRGFCIKVSPKFGRFWEPVSVITNYPLACPLYRGFILYQINSLNWKHLVDSFLNVIFCYSIAKHKGSMTRKDVYVFILAIFEIILNIVFISVLNIGFLLGLHDTQRRVLRRSVCVCVVCLCVCACSYTTNF